MAAMTRMAESTKAIEIELRALNNDSGLISRKLKLLPGSGLLIGRSSTSRSKQLIAAVDNVVLDSPVVSREHARLTAASDGRTLFIKDLGSMHGTRVNYMQLEKNVVHQLRNGDKLQLGAEVIRGEGKPKSTTSNRVIRILTLLSCLLDSFSPPRFDVSFRIADTMPSPQPAPRKFIVPESDSEEDDIAHDASDQDDGGHDSQSSLLEESISAVSIPKHEPRE